MQLADVTIEQLDITFSVLAVVIHPRKENPLQFIGAESKEATDVCFWSEPGVMLRIGGRIDLVIWDVRVLIPSNTTAR